MQDLAEADDRVERGAQLVRHVGEELRLHAVGLLQLQVGPTQDVDRLPLTVVAAGVVEGDGRLVGHDLEHLHQRGVEGAPVLEVDGDGADELGLEEHRQGQSSPQILLPGQPVLGEAGVRLQVLGEDRVLLDHHLSDDRRDRLAGAAAGRREEDALAYLQRLVLRRPLAERDQAGRRAGEADDRLGDSLKQRRRADRGRGQSLRHLAQHLHRGVQAERLLPRLLEEKRVLQGDGDLRAQRGGKADVEAAAEDAMALVGQHQDADGAPARSQRHQQQVPVAEGLRQQLAGLEVVGAVADDERLLGAEDPAEQARWVGREAHLVEAHLVEEPALTHAGGRGGGDQRLQPRLVEEEAAHLHVEELGEPEREGIQVLTQLGQAGDRGGGLEEAGELLDVALGAVGELGVALHEPEVLEAPEAGEEHDGHEEDGREVGRR